MPDVCFWHKALIFVNDFVYAQIQPFFLNIYIFKTKYNIFLNYM